MIENAKVEAAWAAYIVAQDAHRAAAAAAADADAAAWAAYVAARNDLRTGADAAAAAAAKGAA